MNVDRFIDFVIPMYGEQHQMIVAVEELSELQKELTKHLRGKSNREHVLEELSDVQLMLWQLQKIFGFTDAEIMSVVNEKVVRTLNLHTSCTAETVDL